MEKPKVTECDAIEPMLTPFVDGEAGDETRGAVERHAGQCPECARRLAAERAGRTLLQTHRPALHAAAPAALRLRCVPAAARRAALRRWVPLSLAASLVLGAAGAFVFLVSRPTEALAAELAIDHMKCFKLQDTSATADPADLARRWQRQEGWSIVVPPGAPAEGIRLVGLRRCLSTSGQMAHLMYTAHGQPLSIYVWRRAGSGAHELEVLGQRAVIWSSGDRTYAVVGDEPPDVLARVCARVRQAVE